jgi:hypothetical protein
MRVSKLEKRFAPEVNEGDRRVAEEIWERRGLIAEGRNPEEESRRKEFVGAEYQPRTIAEAISIARSRRLQLIGGDEARK